MDIQPTKRFKQKLVIYRHFAKKMGVVERDDDEQKQFVFESLGRKKYVEIYGEEFDEQGNFFAVGKKWKEWQITNWLEDMQPSKPFLFAAFELWEDYKDFPEMLDLLESVIYPQLSTFQKSMVDDVKTLIHKKEH